jgi:predicted dithiol-disulfide oxidoreductase (DUF899 family)
VIPQDYAFQGTGVGGRPAEVRFSELFAPGKDSLVIYNMMFPRALDEDLPCPSCTQFLDSFDGAAEHIAQRVNLAVVAKAHYRVFSPCEAAPPAAAAAAVVCRQYVQP